MLGSLIINDNSRLKKRRIMMRQGSELKKNIHAYRKSEIERCIFLTFDDGPDRRYTPKILDILRKFEVKVSFFLVGKKVEKNPDIVQRIFQEGHDIGNHTYSHPLSPMLFKYRIIEKEIKVTDRIITSITGQRSHLFRSPWSFWNPNYDKIMNIAKRLGYISVGWTISSLDWLGVRKIIKYQILDRDINHGDIILLHDGAEKSPISKRDATVNLLPEILHKVKRRDISLLKLSDLFQI